MQGCPKQFPGSGDEFRRLLLTEDLPGSQSTPRGQSGPRSQALQVLVDGFLQGSLLKLAVCTPRRQSLFSSQTAKQHEPFRTFIVSTRPAKPAVEEPVEEAVPAAR